MGCADCGLEAGDSVVDLLAVNADQLIGCAGVHLHPLERAFHQPLALFSLLLPLFYVESQPVLKIIKLKTCI